MADIPATELLQQLDQPVSRMLAIGCELLDTPLDDNQLDEVFTRLDERSALYERIAQYEQQNQGLLDRLLHAADERERSAAEAVRHRLMEIVHQNSLIEERLHPVQDRLFQSVEITQLKLHLVSTYQPPRWAERRGALVDSRE